MPLQLITPGQMLDQASTKPQIGLVVAFIHIEVESWETNNCHALTEFSLEAFNKLVTSLEAYSNVSNDTTQPKDLSETEDLSANAQFTIAFRKSWECYQKTPDKDEALQLLSSMVNFLAYFKTCF